MPATASYVPGTDDPPRFSPQVAWSKAAARLNETRHTSRSRPIIYRTARAVSSLSSKLFHSFDIACQTGARRAFSYQKNIARNRRISPDSPALTFLGTWHQGAPEELSSVPGTKEPEVPRTEGAEVRKGVGVRHAGLDPASTFMFHRDGLKKVEPGSSPG